MVCTARRVSSCSAVTVSGFDSRRRFASSLDVHRDVGAAGAGIDVDVAVEVGDVEQLLDVVGGDVALFVELRGRALARRSARLGWPSLGSAADPVLG